jgi:hypothetical protein
VIGVLGQRRERRDEVVADELGFLVGVGKRLRDGESAEQLVGGRQLGVATGDQLRASLPEGVGVEPGGRAQARAAATGRCGTGLVWPWWLRSVCL